MQWKSEKAITIIALVITVVVMLILTGVVIKIAFNGSGIIGTTQGSKKQVETSQIQDELEDKIVIKITEGNIKENTSGSVSNVLGSEYAEYDDDFVIVNGQLITYGDQ